MISVVLIVKALYNLAKLDRNKTPALLRPQKISAWLGKPLINKCGIMLILNPRKGAGRFIRSNAVISLSEEWC